MERSQHLNPRLAGLDTALSSLRSWLRTGLPDEGAATGADLAAYRAHTRASARRSLLAMTALLTAFNLFFWCTDAWVFHSMPWVVEALTRGRLILAVLALAVTLGLQHPRAPAYALGMASGAIVCLVTAWTLGAFGGPGTPWFHFLHTFMLAPALAPFLPLRRAAYTLALGALCVLGFFGPRPEYMSDAFAPTTLAHFSYVVALSIAVGWYADSLRLRFFLSQRALAAERESLAARVDEATGAIRRLAHHLDAVQDAERARVARELHDELGQGVTALRMVLKTARDRYERDASAIGPNLSQLSALLQQLTGDTRRLISDLRPRVLDDLGLAPALDWLAVRTSERGVECEVVREGDVTALPAEVSTAAFRCAQEALTNVLKHAGASRAWVRLSVGEGALELIVEDDGVGFDGASQRADAFGVVGMRERATTLGGELTVAARQPSGTAVRVRLPIARGEKA